MRKRNTALGSSPPIGGECRNAAYISPLDTIDAGRHHPDPGRECDDYRI